MADEQRKIFLKNLLNYVNASGKTQKEIAKAIGVSPQTFNTWCQGVAIPRIDKVQMLADYFRINKSDLLEDKSDIAPADPDAAFLQQNPEYRILFDAAKKVKREDLDLVKQMLDRFADEAKSK